GNLIVKVTSKLIGLTSGGAQVELAQPAVNIIDISRSTNSKDVYKSDTRRKVSFYSKNCVRAFWDITVNLKGDLTYQQWTNQGLWNYYWMTSATYAIDYQAVIPEGLSFNPSAGITEITTSGMQMMWSETRYLRINGEDSTYFIQSNGDWVHYGKLMLGTATVVTSDTIMDDVDLSAYATKSYMGDNYYSKILSDGRYYEKTEVYNKTESNGRFALKGGSSTQDFIVKDLIIHGHVDQWLSETTVIKDARVRLNRKEGAAKVASGLDVSEDTVVVSSLEYNTSNRWTIGNQNIATELWVTGTATAYNSASLGGQLASKYPRRDVNESISGFWNFNEGVSIGTTCNNNANSTRYFKIGYFTLPGQYNWGQVTIQVKTRHGANHTIFAGVERSATNISVYRTFQVIGKVLNQTYYLVRTSANVMELWLRNIQSYDNVQISILNRSTAHKFTPDFSTSGTDALPTNESVVTCTNVIKTNDGDITSYYGDITAVNAIFSGNINIGANNTSTANSILKLTNL
ncbi:MAG TPA: hypothetical protein GX731_04695, partial [Clostridiales bacterium]|nr:hypothetical protein [Clostridiales bacterium]